MKPLTKCRKPFLLATFLVPLCAHFGFAQSNGLDSANGDNTSKSWTNESLPGHYDKTFLDSLDWKSQPVAGYVLRTGIIYGKWIAAMQFTLDGKLVLTEYTPPQEYIDVVDPKSGSLSHKAVVSDANGDGVPEIIFLHRKLNDSNYHMYTVYALEKNAPKLIWKSGGELGDWLKRSGGSKRSPERWTGSL